MRRSFFACVLVSLLVGCSASHGRVADSGSDEGGALPDAGDEDGALVDRGPFDAAPSDGGADAGFDVGTGAGDEDAGPADACIPSCGIRTCGEDGCGGLCGRPACTPGVESFERLVPGVITDRSGVIPTPFTFASGLAITQPVPNDLETYGTQAVRVVDCIDGGGFFGFGCADSSSAIPDGTAFMASSFLGVYSIELTLPEPARTVSVLAFRTSSFESILTMDAYDAGDVMVDTASVEPVPIEDWATNSLSVVASPSGSSIVRVLLHATRDAWGLDLVRWQ